MDFLEKVNYCDLNARQKENYNFQKIAGKLAEYGFNCMRLTDDWHGADFLAYHVNGSSMLKVQVKGRLSINRKYKNKDIYISFRNGADIYFIPHDKIMNAILKKNKINTSKSWEHRGSYSWRQMPSWILDIIVRYKLD
jgi:hypothetical protein